MAIVDDEESVCRALGRLIRSAELDVETYTNGAEFLESLESHLPDCVVLDLNMPSLNGIEVQEALAEAGLRLPTVVITGHDTDDARARSLKAGAAAYLRKPVDDQILLDTIAAAVAASPGNLPAH